MVVPTEKVSLVFKQGLTQHLQYLLEQYLLIDFYHNCFIIKSNTSSLLKHSDITEI